MSDWRSRSAPPEEVVASVRSGMTLFLHGAAATPTPLVEALAARTDLSGVRIYHLHTEGPAPFAEPGKDRPTAFESKDGSGVVVAVHKKAK